MNVIEGLFKEIKSIKKRLERLETQEKHYFSNLNLPNAGIITWGTDTNIYRSGADSLTTDDSMLVARKIYIGGVGVTAEIVFGASWTNFDTSLYRGAANKLKTDDSFYVGGKFSLDEAVQLTIASGVVTITKSYHVIETQSGASTDDLDTINGGEPGDILVIRCADDTHTVVVKDGTGNIHLEGDFTMDSNIDILTLIYSGYVWMELARSNNG